MILYQNTIANFKEATENDRLISLMLDSCCEKFGVISPLLKAKLKLILSELYFLFYDPRINDECGIRLE